MKTAFGARLAALEAATAEMRAWRKKYEQMSDAELSAAIDVELAKMTPEEREDWLAAYEREDGTDNAASCRARA